MTRQEFVEKVLEPSLKEIQELFSLKNKSYGIEDDAFHNFRSTALRVHGTDDHEIMFRVLYCYMDKHLVALANRGMDDPECESRLRDIIVYCLIGLAMVKEYKNDLG